jgi:hypothetical protein
MFSLRTLFFAIAVAALGIAALFAQNRYWTSAFVGVTLTIIIAATIAAVYLRTLAIGVFSGVAWLYIVIMLSSFFPRLQTYAPTTTVLVETWRASKPGQVPPQPVPYVYPPSGYAAGGGYGRVVVNPVVTSENEVLYQRALLNGFTDNGDPTFLHYYASGQILCTLIIALIAAQCAAFFLRSKTPV